MTNETKIAIQNIVESANLHQIVSEHKFWGTIELKFQSGKLTAVKTISVALPRAIPPTSAPVQQGGDKQ